MIFVKSLGTTERGERAHDAVRCHLDRTTSLAILCKYVNNSLQFGVHGVQLFSLCVLCCRASALCCVCALSVALAVVSCDYLCRFSYGIRG